MIAALRRAWASLRAPDVPNTAVPAMDGHLTPNTRLDEAPVLAQITGLDNLVATRTGLLCSRGSDVVALSRDGGKLGATVIRRVDKPISLLAADKKGGLAIGLDGQGVLLSGGRHDGRLVTEVGGIALNCPTAAVFLDEDTLLVANGSAFLPAAEWKRDLMTQGASGSVWRIDLSDGAAIQLASGLAYPSGLAVGDEGVIFCSESWRHRVIALSQTRLVTPTVALDKLPAYPGRIACAALGGYWLALFAPRNQLVEFVLTEPDYRRKMIDTIDPDFWIAPALSSGATFLEPIQGGARKKLNKLKPWAPSLSYGLVLRCDARMRASASYHSRADGQVHGVTSVAEQGDMLMVGARGSGVLIALPQGIAAVERAA